MLRLIADNERLQTFQYSFENVELEEVNDEDDEENALINHDDEILDVVGTKLQRNKYRNLYACDSNNKVQSLKKQHNISRGQFARVTGNGHPITNQMGSNMPGNWSLSPLTIVSTGGCSGGVGAAGSVGLAKYVANAGGGLRKEFKRDPSTVERQTIPLPGPVEDIKVENWSGNIKYVNTNRGNKLLYFEGHRYIKNNIYGSNIYWKCTKWHNQCKGRAITSIDSPEKCIMKGVHNHPLLSSDDFKSSFY